MIHVHLEGGASRAIGSVWCIGRNYVAHARELHNPVPASPIVFLKPATAVRGLDPAPVAFASETFDHECELVLLLGEPVGLGERAGWEAVEAVGVGLDLTRRAVQQRCKERGLPWWPAKGFAGSGVVSPFVPLAALGAPEGLTFGLDVAGEARQRGRVADMLFDVPALLGHLARHAPLSPGDLVFTGTPEGVGPIAVGQRFEVWLQATTARRRWSGVL